MNAAIKPISETAETVTFRRDDWLAYLEDMEDRAAVERSLAERAAGNAAVYTSADLDRMLNGVSSLTIWRERAALTQRALATRAGVSASYLAEIEAGRKPGSVAALGALAKTLGVGIERLKD